MKLNLQYSLVVLCLLGNYSCQNQEDNSNYYKEIDVSTGLEITNTNGAPIGVWGSRNESGVNISVFPNPCVNYFKIYSQIGNIKKVWLLAANCQEADAAIPIFEETQKLSYSSEVIEAKMSQVFEVNNEQFEISLLDKPSGDYRVFFEMEDGEIYWKNIKKWPPDQNFSTIGTIEYFCL